MALFCINKKLFIATLFTILILLLSGEIADGVKCYDCYGTGPTNVNCTKNSTCNGAACLIYEAGDNVTSTAFCLLSLEGIHSLKDGCWLEADGKGKHCICRDDFCNQLRDRTKIVSNDPFATPLPNMEFLKHNPLLDYDEIEVNVEDGKIPSSPDSDKHKYKTHILNKVKNLDDKFDKDIDYSNDDDLVPIDFKDYHEMMQNKYNSPINNNKIMEVIEMSSTTTKNPLKKIIDEIDVLKLPLEDGSDVAPDESIIGVEEDLLGIRMSEYKNISNSNHDSINETIENVGELIAHGSIDDNTINFSCSKKTSLLSYFFLSIVIIIYNMNI
uniref:Activin_recp domain-containing protein n=1 Tax=Strongyloides papillosus TaxID=174720 RepID=A0A0N5BDX7_STREA